MSVNGKLDTFMNKLTVEFQGGTNALVMNDRGATQPPKSHDPGIRLTNANGGANVTGKITGLAGPSRNVDIDYSFLKTAADMQVRLFTQKSGFTTDRKSTAITYTFPSNGVLSEADLKALRIQVGGDAANDNKICFTIDGRTSGVGNTIVVTDLSVIAAVVQGPSAAKFGFGHQRSISDASYVQYKSTQVRGLKYLRSHQYLRRNRQRLAGESHRRSGYEPIGRAVADLGRVWKRRAYRRQRHRRHLRRRLESESHLQQLSTCRLRVRT